MLNNNSDRLQTSTNANVDVDVHDGNHNWQRHRAATSASNNEDIRELGKKNYHSCIVVLGLVFGRQSINRRVAYMRCHYICELAHVWWQVKV